MIAPTMNPPENVPSPSAPNSSASGLDLRLVWNVVQDHCALVLLSGVVLFAIVMTATMLSRMEFLVRGRLYLGELDERTQFSAISELTGAGGSDVFSEIEIMRSRSRVERAVLASGLNASLLPSGQQNPRLWQWLLSKRDPELLDAEQARARVAEAALPARASDVKTFAVEFTTADNFKVRDEDRHVVAQGRLGELLESPQLRL